MFAGFNLEINKKFFESEEESFFKYFEEIGEKHLGDQKKEVENSLNKYISNNIIDGSRILNDWFPEVKADIFLSHSSGDKDLVNALAGWLNETFKLKCFVDSNVWGYAGNIAELLNRKYSNKRRDGQGGSLYNHQDCLKVSEHVNNMLNIALIKMIDKCECIFLLNTEKSIQMDVDSKNLDITYSPWIYSELVCSQFIRKRKLSEHRDKVELLYGEQYNIYEAENKGMRISYEVPINHLIKINSTVLKKWSDNYNGQCWYPLDLLYNEYIKDGDRDYV